MNSSRKPTWFWHSMATLAWVFLRLESPTWQALIADRERLFPQTRQGRPQTVLDVLGYVTQALWLLFTRPAPPPQVDGLKRAARTLRRRLDAALDRLDRMSSVATQSTDLTQSGRWLRRLSKRARALLYGVCGVTTLALIVLCVTQPFSYTAQAIFSLMLLGVALWVRRGAGSLAVVVLMVLSLLVSTRYLWWRYTSTLNWGSTLDLALGMTLLLAETYSWLILVLGYAQSAYPLKRPVQQLPTDWHAWPTVDVYIPTYNEPMSVVANTVYAAMGMDWPPEKLRIYILDDGRREAFRQFAAEAGVGYLIRPDNNHAKAGNLNHALTQTHGELIAIFDCDHLPTRSFLQVTTGWFLRDPKLALVQTPHHFFSADPFERNLGTFRKTPNEGELFYHVVQAGNDLWNAAFFCGSCAVLRRTAIESIGGFAVDTVTEDAHTALKMHRLGWRSAYLKIPQAAGLATDSLAAHVNQRIRWARGMAQIFRTDNPFLGKGLTLMQRLCYGNAMLHFMAGIPRIVFLTAPLAFLLLHAYVIYAPAGLLVLYVLPHMVHSALTNQRAQGASRVPFWGEVYETVLAWYIALPTTVALLAPKRGKFNVTDKGGLQARDRFDWRVASPYLLLAALNVAGLAAGIWRLIDGPQAEMGTVVVSMLWTLYNLLIIGSAVAVAAEAHQVRKAHRVATPLPATLVLPDGRLFPATVNDYSSAGIGLNISPDLPLTANSRLGVALQRGHAEYIFEGQVRYRAGSTIGIEFEPMTQQQRVDYVQCTFARADAWLRWHRSSPRHGVSHDLWDVLHTGLHGYQRVIKYAPHRLRWLLRAGIAPLRWLAQLRPRPPSLSGISP
ncbi:UDP-forming cellulose synthase catalytic subunit [Sinimarinibacterium sp. NLF-5-8]|uniref:UDP-forming cellulose synthase catalytic subunit n=1 Tax=Sinimarinibacterium sp. NLF-5-8 TaxID=2698684 RepID=UPI00192EE0AD|nr:UDP-forming cellulose synthase catalytic subunit [Sinimarinibacterium sp. NLF-5-8]